MRRLQPWQRQCFGSLYVMPTASDSIAEVLPAHLTHVKTPTPIICCKQTHTACGQMHLAVCFMPLFYFSPWFLFPRENSCWLYIGSPIGFCCPQKPEIQILSASCLCVTCHDLNSFLFVRCQILLTEYFLLRQSFSSELHFQFTFTVYCFTSFCYTRVTAGSYLHCAL